MSILEKSFSSPGDLVVWIAVFVLPINSALNPILYTLSTPQVRGILKDKLGRLWNYLKSIFPCCDQHHEDQGEQEQQNQQGIGDNVQHDDAEGVAEGRMAELAAVALHHAEQGEAEVGMIELAAVGSPPPQQEPKEKVINVVRADVHVRKRTTVRLVLPASSSKQETEEILEPGDTQPKLPFEKKKKGDKELDSTKCKPKADDSSATASKESLGEETVTCETAL